MHWTLRWLLIAILNRIFPPEKPSEEEYIAYLKDKERHHEPDLPVALIEHSGPLTPVRPPVLGIRQRAQLRQMSGEQFFAPFRRIELVADDSWLNSDPPTQPIVEETQKYRVPPKFLREG